MKPRFIHVRCLECDGKAQLYTAQKALLGAVLTGSRCYFCKAEALTAWGGKTKSEALDEMAAALPPGTKVFTATELMTHFQDATGYYKLLDAVKKSNGTLAAEFNKYHWLKPPQKQKHGFPKQPDQWFRDALKGMGLG